MNKAIECVTKNYLNFEGRAGRSEFWLYTLIYIIGSVIATVLDGMLGGTGLLAGIYSLALLLPTIAVGVRRLHDTDRSGWWYLMWFVPLIGWIWMIVLMVLPGNEEENRFGSEPA